MKRVIIGMLALGLVCGLAWGGPKGGGGKGGGGGGHESRGKEKEQEKGKGKGNQKVEQKYEYKEESYRPARGGGQVVTERKVEEKTRYRGNPAAAQPVRGVRGASAGSAQVVNERTVNQTTVNRTTVNKTTINRTVVNETVVNKRSVASRYYAEPAYFDSRAYYAPAYRSGSSFSFSLGMGFSDGDSNFALGVGYSRGRYCPPPPVIIRRRPVYVAPAPTVVVVEPAPAIVVVQPQPVVVIEPEPAVVVVPLHKRWYRPEPTVVVNAAVSINRPGPVVVASTCAVYSPLYTPTPCVVVPQAPPPVVVEPAPRYDYGRSTTSLDVNFHYEK